MQNLPTGAMINHACIRRNQRNDRQCKSKQAYFESTHAVRTVRSHLHRRLRYRRLGNAATFFDDNIVRHTMALLSRAYVTGRTIFVQMDLREAPQGMFKRYM